MLPSASASSAIAPGHGANSERQALRPLPVHAPSEVVSLPYPHPSPMQTRLISRTVSNDSSVVIYDSYGCFSGPRALWTFQAYGHRDIYLVGLTPAVSVVASSHPLILVPSLDRSTAACLVGSPKGTRSRPVNPTSHQRSTSCPRCKVDPCAPTKT